MGEARHGNGFVGIKGFAIALVGGLILCWPIVATQSVLVFPDSGSYIRGGAIIWDMIADRITQLIGDASGGSDSGSPLSQAGAEGTADQGDPDTLRSLLYSLTSYALFLAAGLKAISFMQGALVVFMLLALLPDRAPRDRKALSLGLVYVVFLTGVAWFTSYLMPDIYAAIVVIYGAVLVSRFRDYSWPRQLLLAVIASFAVAAHYGHPLIALVLYGLVFLFLLFRRELTPGLIVGILLPILVSPALNLVASSIALEKPSIAPLRMPIMLARSLQDGPARWYLADVCPEADYAYCEAFPDREFTTGHVFLFDKDGYEGLSNEMAARILDEEVEIVRRATLRYPFAQVRRSLRNIGITLTRAGLRDVAPHADVSEGVTPRWERIEQPLIRRIAGKVVPWATWIGTLPLLVIYFRGRLDPDLKRVVAFVIIGIIVNAVIFGGLSAPAERYQSRVIWLLPLLSVLALSWNTRRTSGVRVPPV